MQDAKGFVCFAICKCNVGAFGCLEGGLFEGDSGLSWFGCDCWVVHFGLQVGMVPDFCVSERGFVSEEDFLRALKGPKCSEVSWSILGVPVSVFGVMVNGLGLGWSIFWSGKRGLRGA